jgi:hypothetical protein
MLARRNVGTFGLLREHGADVGFLLLGRKDSARNRMKVTMTRKRSTICL